MTFEGIFLAELRGRGFGASEYTRTFKKRPHISKSKLDAYSNCTYLKVGDFFSMPDYKETESRYVSATPLTYDMLLSLYDVNTRSAAVARFVYFTNGLRLQFEKFIKSMKRPNFEVRIIGMQDGEAAEPLYGIAEFISQNRLHLFEADLFGKQVRHISIDISSGMSYNVLLQDRIYRPGELANSTTMEQFERSSPQNK